MGSGADDKLKEIEQLRASLGSKLEELERRIPVAGMGKKLGAALAGSSVAGSALAFGLKRLRRGDKKLSRKDRKRLKEQPVYAPAPVTVNVFPKGAAWLAAAGLAAYAGFKVYEAVKSKSGDGADFRPSVVKQMPDAGRG